MGSGPLGLTFGAQAQADPGWYANGEFLLLAPKTNSTGFDNFFYEGKPATAVTRGNYESDLEPAFRVIVGHEDCCVFGGRVRYFHYDNESDYTGLYDNGAGTILMAGGVDIEAHALDVEVTQRGDFQCSDWLVSGGLRHGGVDITEPNGIFGVIPVAAFFGPTGVEFSGTGPTVSGEASRHFGGCSGLSLFGRARSALLFGDIDVTSPFRGGVVFNIEDEFVHVWEYQLGIQYDHCFCGKTAHVGVFWEAQRWDSESNALGDLAFHGLEISTGLRW